jgi:hypothetical protein
VIGIALVTKHLNVGQPVIAVVLLGKEFAHPPVTFVIVYAVDLPELIVSMVGHGKQVEAANHFRRHEVADKAFILVVAPGKVQYLKPVATSEINKPLAIFSRRSLTDAPNIARHHAT